MTEITPALDEIRAAFVLDNTRNFDSYLAGRSLASEREAYGTQFDAALAAHDAQVLRDAALSSDYGTTAQSALPARADRIAGGTSHE